MQNILRHGLEVSRHHFKGVYVCKVSTKTRRLSVPTTEVVCTLYEGKCDSDVERERTDESDDRFGACEPITFTYQGVPMTLRPWDADDCIIAAAIQKQLIHFPIRPGGRVFALDCTLRTLSHIADIVGPNGRLIGVLSTGNSQRPLPTRAEMRSFFKRYPGVPVITEDVQNPTLEGYRRLLGLTEASRWAFMMALHPRVGADSPVRKLAAAPAKLMRRIFDFLEGWDASDMSCLVSCHWPPGTRVDVIREVVLSHVDILKRMKAPKSKQRAVDDSTGKETPSPSEEDIGGEAGTGAPGDSEEKGGERSSSKSKRSSAKGQKQEPSPLWVLLDLPIDRIVTGTSSADVGEMLSEVFHVMKRHSSGLRTGWFVKEQLMLMPHFPSHALLVLKYSTHRNERMRKLTRRNTPVTTGLVSEGEVGPVPPPTSVPVPAFPSRKLGGDKAVASGSASASASASASGSASASASASTSAAALAAATAAAVASIGKPPGLTKASTPPVPAAGVTGAVEDAWEQEAQAQAVAQAAAYAAAAMVAAHASAAEGGVDPQALWQQPQAPRGKGGCVGMLHGADGGEASMGSGPPASAHSLSDVGTDLVSSRSDYGCQGGPWGDAGGCPPGSEPPGLLLPGQMRSMQQQQQQQYAPQWGHGGQMRGGAVEQGQWGMQQQYAPQWAHAVGSGMGFAGKGGGGAAAGGCGMPPPQGAWHGQGAPAQFLSYGSQQMPVRGYGQDQVFGYLGARGAVAGAGTAAAGAGAGAGAGVGDEQPLQLTTINI